MHAGEKLYNHGLEQAEKHKLTIKKKDKLEKKKEKTLMTKKKMLKESELYYVKRISRELLTAFTDMNIDNR